MPSSLPPAPISTTDLNSYQWRDWFRKIHMYVTGVSSILWTTIDFSGSSISDIEDRQHNELQVIQGGTTNEYYHLTNTDYVGNGTGTLVRTTSPTLVTPVLGDATATSVVSGTLKATSAAGYISSDGSTGYTGTVTTASLVGKTITIKDGIITGFA